MRRLYRRVCVLRATGQDEAAAALEHTELARALGVARLATDDVTHEQAVLEQEAERVAQAHTLAELMVPLLAHRLRAELPALNRSSALPAAPTEPSSPPVTPPARGPAGEVPAVADLIESMLLQQNPRGPRRS